MFRSYDIVSTSDGRKGLVNKVSPHKGHVTVQFGSDGPFKKFHAGSLRFAQSQFLEDCGGVDFYKIRWGK